MRGNYWPLSVSGGEVKRFRRTLARKPVAGVFAGSGILDPRGGRAARLNESHAARLPRTERRRGATGTFSRPRRRPRSTPARLRRSRSRTKCSANPPGYGSKRSAGGCSTEGRAPGRARGHVLEPHEPVRPKRFEPLLASPPSPARARVHRLHCVPGTHETGSGKNIEPK